MKKFFCTLYSIRWKLLNYAIILLLLYQIIYCAVTFLYIVPEGMGPTYEPFGGGRGQVPDEILYKKKALRHRALGFRHRAYRVYRHSV